MRRTRRRAIIVEELANERFGVEYLPEPSDDPIDRDSATVADVGGIYAASDLEPYA